MVSQGKRERMGEESRVLTAVARVMERLVERNESLVIFAADAANGDGGTEVSVFQGSRTPSIGISKYLGRISRYTRCSPSCFVVGFAYVDRISHRYPSSFVPATRNAHRLLLTSVMVASKVLDDLHYNNAFYARVGGVSIVELNQMELKLLFMLDFNVTMSSRDFDCYCAYLHKELPFLSPSSSSVSLMKTTSSIEELPHDDLDHHYYSLLLLPYGNNTNKELDDNNRHG